MRVVRHLIFALVFGALAGLGFAATAWASHQFSDVPNSHPFHDDISWAKSRGLANGYPNGTFKPDDDVSRGALTAWLRRYTNKIVIRHHSATFNNATEVNNSVTCMAGERPIAGGGSTDAFNTMLTDVSIGPTSVSVRWESDNNAMVSGSSDVWATCMPAP